MPDGTLRGLVDCWCELARVNRDDLPRQVSSMSAWQIVYKDRADIYQRCADDLDAALRVPEGQPPKCDCGGIPFHAKHCPVYKAEARVPEGGPVGPKMRDSVLYGQLTELWSVMHFDPETMPVPIMREACRVVKEELNNVLKGFEGKSFRQWCDEQWDDGLPAREGGSVPAASPPWQLIATAPKDGTRVWLWNGYRRCIGWHSHYEDASSGWHRQSLMGEPLGRRDIDPETHWMPLPEAPPASQGGDQSRRGLLDDSNGLLTKDKAMPDGMRELLIRADSYLSLLWHRHTPPNIRADADYKYNIERTIADLRRASAAVPEGGPVEPWQPIATYPKDTAPEVLIGWFEYGRNSIHVAFWHGRIGAWCQTHSHFTKDPNWQPSHWMPLPEAPPASQGGEQ